MNTLEAYFQSEHPKDSAEIEEVDAVLRKVLPIFHSAFSHEAKAWPYKVISGVDPSVLKYSTSTNSMILVMMKLAENKVDRKHFFPSIAGESIFNFIGLKAYKEKWQATKKLAEEKYFSEVVAALGNNILLYSDTYGVNDPLSLQWCVELLRKSELTTDEEKLGQEIKRIVAEKASSLTKKTILEFVTLEVEPKERPSTEDTLGVPKKYLDKFQIIKPELNLHSFVSLKLLQLCKHLDLKFDNTDEVFKFFESRLHLQLSYSDIPDSRFDPAELVFSLEGALRVKKNAVSKETIERAFQVIERAQNLTPYWRPINPIYATAQGQILLPLSIEVANSLLRVCSLLSFGNIGKESFFSKHPEMFKRYFRWLVAQIRQIKIGETDCWGWASEHVGGDNEVHLFQTSEISCFLINYRHMLQERIAGRSLHASGLKVEYPARTLELESVPVEAYWCGEVVENFEPLLELDESDPYKLYVRIGEKFILPRGRDEKPLGYSMLLYGPPGTGKSTVGENICKALKWKMITVTPSDFLAGGAGEVEARAKRIFNCLEEQKDAVILFDEIDHFLLDRESAEYRHQTGIFQFMTPGMLPKLNNLRKKRRSIFIIATNFEERIDPAIKRAGRIDLKLPLMPPAQMQRSKIIERIQNDPDTYGVDSSWSCSASASELVGCTFSDLVGNCKPSLKSEQYKTRFFGDSHLVDANHKELDRTPFVECVLLTLIEWQARSHGSGSSLSALSIFKEFLNKYGLSTLVFDGKHEVFRCSLFPKADKLDAQ